jgi:cell division protein ZapA
VKVFGASLDIEKKIFDIKIVGVSFRLRSSHDEETVKELVDFVNQSITQAMSFTKSGSFQNAAVLSALNIAEELILLRRKAKQELEQIENKVLNISNELSGSTENSGVIDLI